MKKKDKHHYDPMYEWAKDLFPINRSLTGPGVRETLNYIKKLTLKNYLQWKLRELMLF